MAGNVKPLLAFLDTVWGTLLLVIAGLALIYRASTKQPEADPTGKTLSATGKREQVPSFVHSQREEATAQSSLSEAERKKGQLETELRVAKLETKSQLQESEQKLRNLQSRLTEAKEEKVTIQSQLQNEKEVRYSFEQQVKEAQQMSSNTEGMLHQVENELGAERGREFKVREAMWHWFRQADGMRDEETLQGWAQNIRSVLKSHLGEPEAEYFISGGEKLKDSESEASRVEALLEGYLTRLSEIQKRLERRY